VAANQRAAVLAQEIRAAHPAVPILISGCVGPHGDAYSPAEVMTAGEAEDYHSVQIGTLADAGVDLITALTLAYVDEAVGITRAAQRGGLPVVISFTLETDGRLPSGQTLRSAIEETDARTDSAPTYYMINCVRSSSTRRRSTIDATGVRMLTELIEPLGKESITFVCARLHA
jgi:S-methylmethionine-dependent homocysteine/selenocysteine methylase